MEVSIQDLNGPWNPANRPPFGRVRIRWSFATTISDLDLQPLDPRYPLISNQWTSPVAGRSSPSSFSW